ncbi:MAG TPA: tripartite tricarboxylate transporter substrate binding protein, partial [Burkholderiales bacterium]|nr:tripartite tricarboxylate transporter substrate binding protein [Burkholderiales bacterium]
LQRLALQCAAALASLTTITVAGAQTAATYPSKSVRIVIPFGTGGSNLISRWLAPKFSDAFGQTFVVDPRAGAGGNIGYALVAKSPPDGYTLMISPPGIVFSPFLYRSPGYDPLRDFTAIAVLGSVPNVMALHPSVPAQTLQQLIELARKQPKKLAYGSGGIGSTNHLAMEALKSLTKTDIVHIPYKGATIALVDLISGQVDIVVVAVSSVAQYIQHGKLRGIATLSAKRSAALPHLPTSAEAGQPQFVMDNWYGFYGPAGMPGEIVARLNAEAVKAMKMPDTRERLGSQGFDLFPSSPQELAALVKSEYARFGKIIKDAGMLPE